MMYPKLHVSGINRGRNLRLTFSCATPVCLQPPRATDPCVPSSRAWSHWTKWKGSGWSRVWPHAEIVTAFPQPDPTNTDSVRTTWSTSGIIVPIRRGHNVPYILICTYYLIAFCMIYFSVLSPPLHKANFLALSPQNALLSPVRCQLGDLTSLSRFVTGFIDRNKSFFNVTGVKKLIWDLLPVLLKQMHNWKQINIKQKLFCPAKAVLK